MRVRSFRALGAFVVLALGCGHAGAQAVSTTFTYQGKLMSAGAPASGTYDFQFKLFDGATGGTQVGSTNCYDGITVTDGLVTLTLSFGNAFSSGTERYLEVGVRADTTPGNCSSGVYTTLSPRQDVTGTPLAIGLRLPFSGTASSSSDLLTLTNTGAGRAIYAASSVDNQQAIDAHGVGAGGMAVQGTNDTNQSSGALGVGTSGVLGISQADYGVAGQSSGADGAAVYGNNLATTGAALGGSFTTASPNGVGAFGVSNAVSGSTIGVEGLVYADYGVGLYGFNGGYVGPAFGVFGSSLSDAGTGVYGFAQSSSGVNYGVYGTTNSTSGYAGYFVGRSYFSDNVGINTAQPSVPLQVGGGTDLTLAGGGNIVIGQTGGSNLVMDNNEIQARANGGAASLYINANGGNVGIGTGNAQGFQLAVNGSAAKPGGGSWSTLSDARLKKNVRPLTGALDTLLQLRGVTFEYIDPACINELTGVRTGMIAQEVEKVFPDWVDQGPGGMRRVTYRGFEALTVEALRVLKTRQDTQIAEKDAEIALLRARLDKLESIVAALASQSVPAHSEIGAAR